jgi:hypothetical protein
MNNKSGYRVQGNMTSNSAGFYSINLESTGLQCEETEDLEVIFSSVIYRNPSHSNNFLTLGIAILSLTIGYLIRELKKYFDSKL